MSDRMSYYLWTNVIHIAEYVRRNSKTSFCHTLHRT